MNENDNSGCYTRLDLQASVVFTSLGQGRENLRKNAERKTNCYYQNARELAESAICGNIFDMERYHQYQ